MSARRRRTPASHPRQGPRSHLRSTRSQGKVTTCERQPRRTQRGRSVRRGPSSSSSASSSSRSSDPSSTNSRDSRLSRGRNARGRESRHERGKTSHADESCSQSLDDSSTSGSDVKGHVAFFRRAPLRVKDIQPNYDKHGTLLWRPEVGDLVWAGAPGGSQADIAVAIVLGFTRGDSRGDSAEVYRVAYLNDDSHGCVDLSSLRPFDGEEEAARLEVYAANKGKSQGQKHGPRMTRDQRKGVRDALAYLDREKPLNASHNFSRCAMCRFGAAPRFWALHGVTESDLEREMRGSAASDSSEGGLSRRMTPSQSAALRRNRELRLRRARSSAKEHWREARALLTQVHRRTSRKRAERRAAESDTQSGESEDCEARELKRNGKGGMSERKATPPRARATHSVPSVAHKKGVGDAQCGGKRDDKKARQRSLSSSSASLSDRHDGKAEGRGDVQPVITKKRSAEIEADVPPIDADTSQRTHKRQRMGSGTERKTEQDEKEQASHESTAEDALVQNLRGITGSETEIHKVKATPVPSEELIETGSRRDTDGATIAEGKEEGLSTPGPSASTEELSESSHRVVEGECEVGVKQGDTEGGSEDDYTVGDDDADDDDDEDEEEEERDEAETTCSQCGCTFADKWTGQKWETKASYCVDCAFVCICGVLTPYAAAFVCQERILGPYCENCWKNPSTLGCSCADQPPRLILATEAQRKWESEAPTTQQEDKHPKRNELGVTETIGGDKEEPATPTKEARSSEVSTASEDSSSSQVEATPSSSPPSTGRGPEEGLPTSLHPLPGVSAVG